QQVLRDLGVALVAQRIEHFGGLDQPGFFLGLGHGAAMEAEGSHGNQGAAEPAMDVHGHQWNLHVCVPRHASLLQHSTLRYRCPVLRCRAFSRFPRMLLAVLLAACSSAAVQAAWISREEAIMGTRCAVELWSEDEKAGEAAIEAVLADMRRIDALMSTYKP